MKSNSKGLSKPKCKQRRVSLGDGLVRLDRPGGTSSWVCRVQKDGVRRDFGLGSCQKVSLAHARELAQEIREQVEIGIDPHFERRKRQAVPTFTEAAAKTYEIHSKTWRNGKHHAQWMRTMELYAFPHIGKFKVDQITGPMIRDLLAEIWLAKPETARRVRQRIGAVLDWAYASGYRDTDAPMRAITKGLPRQPRRDNHFAAMPYEDVPAFVQRLRERESFSRLALEFAIFTAARSGEVRGATWGEFDLEKGLWKLSKDRMKAYREHVVPLTRRPLRIVERCARLRIKGCDLVFPGMRRNRPLSDQTLTKLLKEMDEPYTAHGFRSSFRDWVSEETNHPSDVAEAALNRAASDAVVRQWSSDAGPQFYAEAWGAEGGRGEQAWSETGSRIFVRTSALKMLLEATDRNLVVLVKLQKYHRGKSSLRPGDTSAFG